MKKTMEINGVKFELIEKHFTRDELCSIAYSTHDLSYFYARPSQIKVDIYQDWLQWSYDVENLFYFNVSGANSSNFTMKGIIERPEGDIVLVITKAHNRAYVCK